MSHCPGARETLGGGVDVLRKQSVHVTAMTEVPFHATRLGRILYERHVPELIRQIEQLNENVAALTEAIQNSRAVAGGDREPETE